jgi:hypothetical protein
MSRNVLIDINTVLDFLCKRRFHIEASRIFDLASDGHLAVYFSAHEVTTLSCFLDLELRDRVRVRTILTRMLDLATVIPTTKDTLVRALTSEVADFEDAVLEIAALDNKLLNIITRNVKDFKHSRVEAINPGVFLEIIEADMRGSLAAMDVTPEPT